MESILVTGGFGVSRCCVLVSCCCGVAVVVTVAAPVTSEDTLLGVIFALGIPSTGS